MNPTYWLWLFRLAVAADLVAIYFQWVEVRYVSKPLIVLSLLAFFSQQVKTSSGAANLIKAALFFSLVGDVALLFEDRQPLFFMVGLGSFLVAHLLYIAAFANIRKKQKQQVAPDSKIPGKTFPGLHWFWVIAVLLYLGILLYILMPFLDELKVPVVIYSLVLCGMLLSVVHAFRSPYAKPGIICVAGALLFVISDSVLAINKFYVGFPLAGLVIMFTYACAQYLLTTGTSRLLQSRQTAKFELHSAS